METWGGVLSTVPNLLCFGAGYVAGAAMGRLAAAGWIVAGTRRQGQDGAISWQAGQELPGAALAQATHLLLSIPPDPATGDPVLAALGGTGLPPGVRWIGYLSTTGVYGDTGGAWVDETAPLRPDNPRSAARIAAEAGWRRLAATHTIALQIFRLAGIYGPGRSPFDALAAGRAHAIDAGSHVTNRIHRDDAVGLILAGLARPRLGPIFNAADDHPCPPALPVLQAAWLAGLPPPPLVRLDEAGLSPMARSFYQGTRRVLNARAKALLGWRPLYPSYREGLAQLSQGVSGAG